MANYKIYILQSWLMTILGYFYDWVFFFFELRLLFEDMELKMLGATSDMGYWAVF